MNNDMTPRDNFKKAFEKLGYSPINGAPDEFIGQANLRNTYALSDQVLPRVPSPFSRKDIWFRWNASTEHATHIVFLENKPLAQAFSVAVGVHNTTAVSLVKAAMPKIIQYVRMPSFSTSVDFVLIRTWMLFDAGRAMHWPTYCIPDPFDPMSWPVQLEALVLKFLSPVFWSIGDPNGILKLLFRTESPFEWLSANTVLRVAEIIALSKVLGLNSSKTRENLFEHLLIISSGMHGAKIAESKIEYCERMIDEFIGYI